MKGISGVIAVILMLMITMALAGSAYLFISGAFSRQTQGIELVDAFCVGGLEARILFRNAETNDITFVGSGGTFLGCTPTTGSPATCGSISVNRLSGGGTASFGGDRTPVAPGTTATLRDTGCTTAGTTRTCIYRITSSGRAVEASVPCTG